MNEIVYLLCQKQPTALKYLLIQHQNSQKQNGSKCTNDNPWTWPRELYWFPKRSASVNYGPDGGCSLNIRFTRMTARESYGWRLSFQAFWSWSWISDKPSSFSLKTATKAHTQNMAKWPRVKLKKTMWVKKVVETLGDSWQGHPATVSS